MSSAALNEWGDQGREDFCLEILTLSNCLWSNSIWVSGAKGGTDKTSCKVPTPADTGRSQQPKATDKRPRRSGAGEREGTRMLMKKATRQIWNKLQGGGGGGGKQAEMDSLSPLLGRTASISLESQVAAVRSRCGTDKSLHWSRRQEGNWIFPSSKQRTEERERGERRRVLAEGKRERDRQCHSLPQVFDGQMKDGSPPGSVGFLSCQSSKLVVS